MLELTDSIVTYRTRYMAQPEWLPLLDLLVIDDSNPRSIRFQLLGLFKYLERLAENHGPCGADRVRLLLNEFEALDIDRDLHCDSAVLRTLLHQSTTLTITLTEQLGLQFFSQTGDINQDTFTPA